MLILSRYMLLPTDIRTLSYNRQVRLLIIYSQWGQLVTATTTRSYVTSIVEGWQNIVDKTEICQTPWFNFMEIEVRAAFLSGYRDG